MTTCTRYLANYAGIRVGRPAHLQFAEYPAPGADGHLADPPGHRAWLRRKLAEPFVGPTVVMTRHAPHRHSLEPRLVEDWSSGGFVSEMPAEFFDVPVLWVHGHTHDSFDYQVDSCRMVCNPRGYMNLHGEFENKGFDPRLVVEVGTSGNPEQSLDQQEISALATQVFGEKAQAWLNKPHERLEGQTPPAKFAAAGGAGRVRSILVSIQYGGVA